MGGTAVVEVETGQRRGRGEHSRRQGGRAADVVHDPCRYLALAVIYQAISDAAHLPQPTIRARIPHAWREASNAALDWLTGESDGLVYWCGLARVTPEEVRRAARKHAANAI